MSASPAVSQMSSPGVGSDSRLMNDRPESLTMNSQDGTRNAISKLRSS